MNNIKKALCLILALLTVSLPLASCSSDPGDTADTTAADTTAAVTEPTETTTARLYADVPETKFDGYEFRVINRENEQDKRLYTNFDREEENGDAINDAIVKRNTAIEEQFDVTISQIIHATPHTFANTTIFAGDDEFDLIQTLQQNLYSLSTQKAFVNYYDIPYLDLDADWWNQAMKRELTINDKLYYLIGDISLVDDVLCFCIIFNKQMWEEYSLDDPYEMVKNSTWTLDKLGSLSAGVNTDINGDGVQDHLDKWGLQSEIAGGNYLYFGSGEHMVTNNGNELEITLGSERSVAVVDDVLALLNSGEVLIGDHLTIDSKWNYIANMFQENRLLMRTSTFEPVLNLRNMEADFGVLPIPKYEESQDVYRSGANQYINALAIPVTNSDLERTGIIMEAMAVESLYTIKPAFYDVSLQGKVLRDNESEDMLDLIFTNQVFDVGHMFNIAGFTTILSNMIDAGTNTIASTVESVRKNAETTLAKVIENYAD